MDVFNLALRNPLPPRKPDKKDSVLPVPEPHDRKKKNSRRKHRNSHLGCGTCKKRRIKCDETLPQCYNCVKGKLHCAYLNLNAPARNALRMAQYNQNLRERHDDERPLHIDQTNGQVLVVVGQLAQPGAPVGLAQTQTPVQVPAPLQVQAQAPLATMPQCVPILGMLPVATSPMPGGPGAMQPNLPLPRQLSPNGPAVQQYGYVYPFQPVVQVVSHTLQPVVYEDMTGPKPFPDFAQEKKVTLPPISNAASKVPSPESPRSPEEDKVPTILRLLS